MITAWPYAHTSFPSGVGRDYRMLFVMFLASGLSFTLTGYECQPDQRFTSISGFAPAYYILE